MTGKIVDWEAAYIADIFERDLRPRFVKLIHGIPGMRGDETFAEVLDIVADRLIPANPVVPVNPANPGGEPMLLGSIPVVSTPGWPEGTVTLVNTRDLDDLADRPATLLGSVPLFRSVVLPSGKRACVQSREPGLMVLVAYDYWSTELLPAQTPCRLLGDT